MRELGLLGDIRILEDKVRNKRVRSPFRIFSLDNEELSMCGLLEN